MTRRGRVRAAEPTAAFSPQRKCKNVWFKSHPRNQKRNTLCPIDKGCSFSSKSVLADGINPPAADEITS